LDGATLAGFMNGVDDAVGVDGAEFGFDMSGFGFNKPVELVDPPVRNVEVKDEDNIPGFR